MADVLVSSMDSLLTAQNPIAIPKWAFYVDALWNNTKEQSMTDGRAARRANAKRAADKFIARQIENLPMPSPELCKKAAEGFLLSLIHRGKELRDCTDAQIDRYFADLAGTVKRLKKMARSPRKKTAAEIAMETRGRF